MGYTDLNCPEIPSRRRLADESPGQPTTMDNLPHAHHHPRNASNHWIPTTYQILIQTRITSQLCHKPAFSDGTYLNHQGYRTTFLSLQNTVRKSSLYNKIPSDPKYTQHRILTAMTTLDISLYLVYNLHDISSIKQCVSL